MAARLHRRDHLLERDPGRPHHSEAHRFHGCLLEALGNRQ
jgi:hypothetical protein